MAYKKTLPSYFTQTKAVSSIKPVSIYVCRKIASLFEIKRLKNIAEFNSSGIIAKMKIEITEYVKLRC